MIRPLFFLVALCSCLILTTTGVFSRFELQTINKMFELRPWLCWNSASIAKLDPQKLWTYHRKHDVPATWWSWDYTLSWLIKDNVAGSKQKIVIFNHTLEDEPPREAIAAHPWIAPLASYPTPRKTVAEVVDFLARAGAREIILDNDFPQFSADDPVLAKAIHDAATGATAGHPVPVLMASTVNHGVITGGQQIEASTLPVGILEQLALLEPNTDVAAKYTGITSLSADEDQIVRRLVTMYRSTQGEEKTSLAVKALSNIGVTCPPNLPALMDIDFTQPPNSEIYPVRPFWYLLDPETRNALSFSRGNDATVSGAIVILGDGIMDVHPTPGTNNGVAMLSGSEILAQSIDTIARGSSPKRTTGITQWSYLLLWIGLGMLVHRTNRSTAKSAALKQTLVLAVLAIVPVVVGAMLFAYFGLIVPVVVPVASLFAGSAACMIADKEETRLGAIRSQLESLSAKLHAERLQHESMLILQEARAKEAQVAADQQRRSEFVRRINHDLKAPVTVLNWTLAKLKREGLTSPRACDRLTHLERTSDRLFDLMAQLVRSYEQDHSQDENANQSCDLNLVLESCVQLEEGLAESREGRIRLGLPDYQLAVNASRVDLERVIDNVIRNAFLHNPNGVELEIVARVKAQFIEISISDNGKGIPQEIIERIFQPGITQSPDATSEGLGMAIVNQLIEKMGGSVSVESVEDVGTTIKMMLPAATVQPFAAVHADFTQGAVVCRKL